MCGSPTLDWAALQKNAKYEGGYTAHSPVVTWLWDIVSATARFCFSLAAVVLPSKATPDCCLRNANCCWCA